MYIDMLYKVKVFFKSLILFIGIILVFVSCGKSQLITENTALKNRIADLEYRIYEISESPDFVINTVLQDVDLLMQNPSIANSNLALALIADFAASYPEIYTGSILKKKRSEINQLLKSISTESSTNDNESYLLNSVDKMVKLQIFVKVIEGGFGFVNVEMKVVNMGDRDVKNLWIKANAVSADGKIFGISQDFFFNSIPAYNERLETLSWEYLKTSDVKGLSLSQLRISENRDIRLLKREECFIGDGNVKIFLVL